MIAGPIIASAVVGSGLCPQHDSIATNPTAWRYFYESLCLAHRSPRPLRSAFDLVREPPLKSRGPFSRSGFSAGSFFEQSVPQTFKRPKAGCP
jgi:hypothetical protein